MVRRYNINYNINEYKILIKINFNKNNFNNILYNNKKKKKVTLKVVMVVALMENV